MPNKALLTGATGFIGGNLARALINEGWEVSIIVRAGSSTSNLGDILPRLTVYEHDRSTENLIDIVRDAEPDTVFHVASLFLSSHKSSDVIGLVESNILFPLQLLEAMAVNKVDKLINTGTSWQHYEDQSFNPVNLYAGTKQAFESLLRFYCESSSLKVITLVLFDTYGVNDPRPKLIALLWRAAISGEVIEMSPGEQIIDLVHINDVTRAFIEASKQLRSQDIHHRRYGVSSGHPMTLRRLVDIFNKKSGHNVSVKFGGRPYRDREVMAPWSQYSILPNWKPLHLFDDEVATLRPAEPHSLDNRAPNNP